MASESNNNDESMSDFSNNSDEVLFDLITKNDPNIPPLLKNDKLPTVKQMKHDYFGKMRTRLNPYLDTLPQDKQNVVIHQDFLKEIQQQQQQQQQQQPSIVSTADSSGKVIYADNHLQQQQQQEPRPGQLTITNTITQESITRGPY
eukprot:UN02867